MKPLFAPPAPAARRRAALGVRLALALAAATGAHAAPMPPPVGALLEGSVSICTADTPPSCAPMHPGEAPHVGATLVSDEGATIRMPGGALLRLEPGARVRLVRTMMVPLRGGESTLAQVMRLEAGTAVASIAGVYVYKTALLFQFSATRNVLAKEGVTGVRASEEGTSMGAVQGTALVTNDGRTWQQLRQGRGRRYAPGAAEGSDYALLSAPLLGPSQRLSLKAPGRPPPSVSWVPLEEARAYILNLTRDGRGDPLRSLRLPASQTSFAFEGLDPGSYALSLRAVDAEGMPGAASEPWPISVLDLSLPPGASFGESGQVHLASHQHLAIAPTDRVQASLGLGSAFGLAPAALELGTQPARLVRLRQEGDEAAVDLLLVRRQLRALVEMGPATAHWPTTPVRVTVRLLDELSQPFEPPPPVHPRVRLGLEPIEVAWQTHGGELTATIEPRELTGPAVLRVEIEDARGTVAGRSFLELLPEPK
jgi:hypothetical protein